MKISAFPLLIAFCFLSSPHIPVVLFPRWRLETSGKHWPFFDGHYIDHIYMNTRLEILRNILYDWFSCVASLRISIQFPFDALRSETIPWNCGWYQSKNFRDIACRVTWCVCRMLIRFLEIGWPLIRRWYPMKSISYSSNTSIMHASAWLKFFINTNSLCELEHGLATAMARWLRAEQSKDQRESWLPVSSGHEPNTEKLWCSIPG